MKIGILTWFMGMNYGTQAQTYALSHFLEAHGYDCCEIAFYPRGYRMTNLKISLAIEPAWYLHPMQCLKSLQRMRNFSQFIKMHKLSRPVKTAKEIDDLNLDAIVIGSDELANCNHPLHDDIYFGMDIIKTPILCYALSAGSLETAHLLSEKARFSLQNIKYISGRDKNTCLFLEHNGGKNVKCMLDPTLLYEFREFAGTIKVQDYILLYSFDTLEDYKEVIQTYARDHSLPILSVGRDYKWVDYSLSYAKESEWLSAFQNAGLVITDSFHGLVFSIKYHKQFVLLRRPDKYSKNESLLEELNIQTEYYTKENSIGTYLSQNKVNYSMVNELLQLKIKESSQYLLEGLNNICV